MPTKPVAAICLGVALVVGTGTGAAMGAAGAVPGWVPDPFGLADGRRELASMVHSYRQLRFEGMSGDGLRTTEVSVRVPSGWSDLERTALWHDLRDPTGQITLRLRAELLEASVFGPRDDALTEVRRLATELEAFDLLGEQRVSARSLPGYEIRYTYLQNGRKRYAAERYLGDGDQRLVIAGYQWSDQPDVITPILDEAVRSLSTDVHPTDS
jgi:hypothetical protein